MSEKRVRDVPPNEIAAEPTIFEAFQDQIHFNSRHRDVILNEHDEFERGIIDIVLMNRRKRADYAVDGDPFSNFVTTAEALGIHNVGVTEVLLMNIAQKLSRLRSLRVNDRMTKTQNESVVDTYLDLAVYSAILYSWVKRELLTEEI